MFVRFILYLFASTSTFIYLFSTFKHNFVENIKSNTHMHINKQFKINA